jgi:ligand-binding sensor domain-containing protein
VSVDRDSSIWCSYNSPSLGVSHLRVDGMWEHYGPDQYPFLKSVLGIAVDSEGGRWFGTWGFGLVHLTPDGRWRVYDTSNSPLPVNTIGPVVTDDTGNVYISAYQEALCRFNVRDLTWKVYRSDFTVAVNEIALDSTGTLWLGSADRGVAYITPDGHADRLVGVASQRTTALAVDRDGRVWVGNLGGVHMVVDRQIVTTYTATGDDRGLLSDVVWDMVGDWDGGMWFESTGSVSRRRPDGKWVHYLPDSGLVSGEIGDIESSLAFDQERGILWIVTGKGLSRYETGIVAWSSPNLEGVVCFPNPFVPGLGHREVTIDHLPSDATVRIYSLCGELIQTLGAPDQFARTYWNGLNGHGKQVASGIYLVSVVTPHAHWVGKLAVVR